jgi:hypothetical protein
MRTVALTIAAVCGLVVGAHAQETGSSADDVSDRDRVFANYIREAATVGHGILRLEVRAVHLEDQSLPDLDVLGFPIERVERREGGATVRRSDGNVFDVLGSFGLGNNAEVGFDVPYVVQDFDFDGAPSQTLEDVGDVSLYLKIKHQVAERCRVGAGVELSLPTGPERKYTGTGETGVNPFVSTRYQRGRIGAGLHIGYFLYTGNVKNVLNYSGELFVRGNSMFAMRVELSGRTFKQFGETFDDVLVYPGLDIEFFEYATIRPTGIFNLTDESQDWGIGIGIAARIPVL